ncbi:MAG: transposase [Isosphaeraceae bacterium]
MSSKAYRSTRVNDVDWERLARGKEGLGITLGIDVGKERLWPVCRWADGRFERPWRVDNPAEIPALLALIKEMSQGRELVVAMESSGTYGDALRQALADRKIAVRRVSNKASHDYAEVFDGVPSQHDGKDAAVIAELAALGKAKPWGYQPASDWEQELTYWVEWMACHRQILTTWQGRLEGLVSRHWPEATRVLKLTSVTLLRALERYGDPKALAADPAAPKLLAAWGGAFLAEEKPGRLVACAASRVGVRVGQWQRRQVQEYARQALAARREVTRAERRLRELAEGNAVLQAQGKVVGVPTACVLWSCVGDPRLYDAAAADRKAMGLNLVERSSGKYQGRLRISKRGSSRARQWLYFAALRLIQTCGVRPWYEAKKARDEDDARRAVVAVMRKLALGLHRVGVKDEAFEPRRLFGRIVPHGGDAMAARPRTRKEDQAKGN